MEEKRLCVAFKSTLTFSWLIVHYFSTVQPDYLNVSKVRMGGGEGNLGSNIVLNLMYILSISES